MATSKRVGNYARSAAALTKSADQIFDAAMSSKPDFSLIAKEAIKGRSLERRAVAEAEGRVAIAGINAKAKVKRTEIGIEADKAVAKSKRGAQRMAGILGGLGTLAGAAALNKENQIAKREKAEDKAERDAYYAKIEAINQKSRDADAELRKQWTDQLKGLNNSGSSSSSNTSTDNPAPDVATAFKAPALKAPASTQPASSGNQASANSFGGVYKMAQNSGAAYPELVAAQWALESAYGKTPSGKNNFFGMKATGSESSSSKQTWEVINGKEITTSANFKNYESPQASVDDLVSKWHKDYGSYKGVNNAGSAEAAADMLLQENYATDPAYAEKLKRIMSENGF